ncbi:hypothetical protein ABZ543_08325 [Streptomyces roseifaciens]
MTQTCTASTLPEQFVEPLPPFSGDSTECGKCSHTGALTRYQQACPRGRMVFNGATCMRGPLPERLERTCQRCGFEWDESLDTAPAIRPATVEDLVYALQLCAPYPVHPQAAEHTAFRLMEVFDVQVRLGHPVWNSAHTRPVPAPGPPAQPDPAPAAPPAAPAGDTPPASPATPATPPAAPPAAPAGGAPVPLQDKRPSGPTASTTGH